MKRIIALLLLLCLCLPLVACGGGGETDKKPDGTQDAYQFQDSVGDHNFEGEEFVVSMLPAYEWEIYKEEKEPNAFHKATEDRNRLLQNRFNMKIVTDMVEGQNANDHASKVRIAMQDGNPDMLDIILIQRWLVGPVVMTGMLCDLRSEVPYVKDSIGKTEWWDAKINDCYTVFGRQYVGVSDLNITALANTWAILYNRTLDKNYAGEVHKKIGSQYNSLYDVVDDGAWTLDNMNLIVKDFWKDNPATGKIGEADVDDIYGLTSAGVWGRELFGDAFGYDLVINDGENVPTLMNFTSGMATAIENLRQLFTTTGYNNNTSSDWGKNFADGKALLYMTSINSLNSETIHETDEEFGVLPFPKATATQKEYYAGTQDAMSTVIVPLNLNERVERTGVILEAMAAESNQTCMPAYYEVVLKYNATRDPDSVRMLDLINHGRRYNLAGIHSTSSDALTSGGQSLAYIFRFMLQGAGTTHPADVWATYRDGFEKGLENLIGEYEDLAAMVS